MRARGDQDDPAVESDTGADQDMAGRQGRSFPSSFSVSPMQAVPAEAEGICQQRLSADDIISDRAMSMTRSCQDFRAKTSVPRLPCQDAMASCRSLLTSRW